MWNSPTKSQPEPRTMITSPGAPKIGTILVHVGLDISYTIASTAIVEGNRCQNPKGTNGS